MTTYVINGEDTSLPVEIRYPSENNRLDSVFIMGKSKAKLPAFSEVTPGFLLSHPRVKTQTVDGESEPLIS